MVHFAVAQGLLAQQPFFHIIATSLASEIGEARPREVIATTLAAFAFSSILTGLTFFLLGALRLGTLIGFFPRHILIGCIGGVGVFLIITGSVDFLIISSKMLIGDPPDLWLALGLRTKTSRCLTTCSSGYSSTYITLRYGYLHFVLQVS